MRLRPPEISIHALREEGDVFKRSKQLRPAQFLSTPSARRATQNISRHCKCNGYFYPRPPRGGRPVDICEPQRFADFYPRPPRGGRLVLDHQIGIPVLISIHALREEGDFVLHVAQAVRSYFYPRPPRGGRPDFCLIFTTYKPFLSTPSARRATTSGKFVKEV